MLTQEIIDSLFLCPECYTDLLMVNTSTLKCLSCCTLYSIDDDMIDFGVAEQKHGNNWSQTTSEVEMQQWLDEKIKQGHFTHDDIENAQTGFNEETCRKTWELAVNKIREAYVNRDINTILDLATGPGSIFNSGFGEFNLDCLTGKTIILTDLSKLVLGKVKETLKKADATIIYCVSDITRLPIKSNSIDLVSSVGCFNNSLQGATIVSETKRILRNNGTIKIFEILFDENSRTQNFLVSEGQLIEFTSEERLIKHLESEGFMDIAVDILFHDISRIKGDLLPLKGDKSVFALISAIFRNGFKKV